MFVIDGRAAAMQASEHASRRKSAAAAAAAADIRPINANQVPRRPIRVPGAAPKAPKASTSKAPLAPKPAPAPSADLPDFSGATGGVQPPADKASRPPKAPLGPLPTDENGERSLLQSRPGIDADESYGTQEHALSTYLKLHPVLSLESTSYETLQLVANLVDSTSIPTRELEIVPKPHDDQMLRPPNVDLGERPCNFGNRCICVWMARWRYGDDTDMAFIGTEFLLPSQAAEFKRSGKLPHTPGKCLVCSRYVQTYIYRCARADPTFKPSAAIPLQAYGNSLGVEAGESVPTHSSVASDSDGYRQEALLFVDEQWADTAAARGAMASLLWRPCVKFDTSHYEYVKDPSGRPRLLQHGVGAEEETPLVHFCQPVGEAKRPPLPANPQTPPPNPTSPA